MQPNEAWKIRVYDRQCKNTPRGQAVRPPSRSLQLYTLDKREGTDARSGHPAVYLPRRAVPPYKKMQCTIKWLIAKARFCIPENDPPLMHTTPRVSGARQHQQHGVTGDNCSSALAWHTGRLPAAKQPAHRPRPRCGRSRPRQRCTQHQPTPKLEVDAPMTGANHKTKRKVVVLRSQPRRLYV